MDGEHELPPIPLAARKSGGREVSILVVSDKKLTRSDEGARCPDLKSQPDITT